MSIYRYPDTSPVQEVAFHQEAGRSPVALLDIGQDALPLKSLRAAINDRKWQSVPVHIDGKEKLQITGFKNASDITVFLRAQNLTQGDAAITTDPPAAKPKAVDRIKNVSLKLAGGLNMLGTTGGFLAGGFKKKDPFLKGAAGLYLISEGNLIRYGNANSSHYAREIAEELGDFIRKQGGSLPQGSELANIMRHQRTGLLARTDNFLYRNPAHVTLALGSAAATAVTASGIKDYRAGKGAAQMGYGIGSIALKVLSLAIPEKSKEQIAEDKAKGQNIFQKGITWIQEKPLRFYGLASIATDIFLPFHAYKEYKIDPVGKKGWVFTAIAGVSYTLADVMYSISSKEHSNDDKGKLSGDEQRALEAMAAESLAKQPEASRDAMAYKVGGFLARRKEMRGNAESIRSSILEQARHQKDSSWVQRGAQESESLITR